MTTPSGFLGALLAALFVVQCFTMPLAWAESEPRLIQLPFRAAAGDRFTVKISIIDKKLQEGQETQHLSRVVVYDGHVRVADANGYVISWTGKSSSAKALVDQSGTAALQVQVSDELARAFKGVPTVFEATETGAPIRIRDWPALSNKLAAVLRTNLMTALRTHLSKKAAGKTQEQIDAILHSQIEQMVQSLVLRHDDRSAIVLLEAAGLIAAVQHRVLPLGKTIDAESQSASLLSDAAIPSTNQVTLSRYDKAKNEAEIVWTSAYDRDAMKAIAFAAAEAQLRAANVPNEKLAEVRKQFDDLQLDRVDRGRALVSIKDGWARRVEFTRHISTGAPNEPKREELTTKLIEITRHSR